MCGLKVFRNKIYDNSSKNIWEGEMEISSFKIFELCMKLCKIIGRSSKIFLFLKCSYKFCLHKNVPIKGFHLQGIHGKD